MVLLGGRVPRPTQALRSRTGAHSGLQGGRELGRHRAAGPGFTRGSPSSCCPGSQWRGRWTSAGGSGLGTALSSRPPARCTWLQESKWGSVTPGPGTPTPGSHFTPRTGVALSLGACRIPSWEGAPATPLGTLGPHSQSSSLAHFLLQNLQNIYIYFLDKQVHGFFFLALKNRGKLSNRFSTRQFQCYNLGTNSVADEKCFPLEKRK